MTRKNLTVFAAQVTVEVVGGLLMGVALLITSWLKRKMVL